ncbi:MAG TPA: glycoside hydrolase family 3 C-terminal domain-containing protein [Lacunisphaera sp.]
MKLRLLLLLAWLGTGVASSATDYDFPFRDPDRPVEERITDLIGRMTLDEKINNLSFLPGVPRLGVVGTNISEGYHGVAQGGPSNWGKRNPTRTTQFPQAYGLAATWDPALLQRVAANQATEVRWLFQSEKYHRSALVVMAPNADLARDPRWGRTEETYGEDPFLGGTLAAAFVRGLAGDDPRYFKATSLLKHFLANSNENGRFHTSSNFDERLWREYYAKTFEMAVRDGGARSMMAAYNAINGTPAHVHPMLRDIVMGEWGLDGIICTDGGGLSHLVNEHKVFPDIATATAACLKAGINLFLDRIDGVKEALTRGLLTEADIDQAIRGRLRMFIRLGLLDPVDRVPYAKIGREGGIEPWDDPATKVLVREVTRKSIVLLRNEHRLLPLDATKLKSVAVVGPLANTVLLDWYSGTPPYAITPRDGIEAYASSGVPRVPDKFGVKWVADMSDTAVEAARKCDVVVVCVGNHPESNASWEILTEPSDGKEGADRQSIDLPPAQVAFIKKVLKANPRTVVALVANFPYAMPWVVNNVPAIVQLTHASQEQGHALADVLFGDFNPGGKLVQTWPKSLADLPPMMDYDIRHGRTYQYAKQEPQYAFGYGLSYTTFALSGLSCAETLARDGALEIRVEVANTGTRAGDEVVQLYVRFPQSKVERAPRQLKGFQRITVEPGQKATATINLRAADLAYWDIAAHAWVVEPGPVELLVGTSSREADLTLRKTVVVGP